MSQKILQRLTSTSSSPFIQKPIIIIGAGLAGLSLARTLIPHHIPFVIYDAFPSPRRHNYGITLYTQAITSITQVCGIESHQHEELRSWKSSISIDGTAKSLSSSRKYDFRVNRGRLESVLREGLDIKYGHEVSKVEFLKDSHGSALGLKVEFSNGSSVSTDLIIAADGVHSVFRTFSLADPTELPLTVRHMPHGNPPVEKDRETYLNILPYVVINGTRDITRAEFNEMYAKAFENRTVIFTSPSPGINLKISISSNFPEEKMVTMNYTYSRPVRTKAEYGADDKLWNPTRLNGEASVISEEFFDELFVLEKELQSPYDEMFAVDRVRHDRLLSWLMRASSLPKYIYDRLANRGIISLGDAVFAQPILGGDAGNRAIMDGIDCGRVIVDRLQGQMETVEGKGEWAQGRDMDDWKDLREGLRVWAEARYEKRIVDVKESILAINKMHRGSTL